MSGCGFSADVRERLSTGLLGTGTQLRKCKSSELNDDAA